MKEFNNRDIADKFAEYITGQELRKYLAEKVKKYINGEIIVFDGAVGSGQLEQYISLKELVGCDIQNKAIEVAKENYPNNKLIASSFFDYNEEIICDCTIMNPPFSIKFKDLSIKEQENIQKQFSWKKSGVVDDIFVLKSLKYSKRYGFYILFPGVAYRKTEEQFRKILKNTVLELNIVENAFEDTSIPVLFLIIDKEKTEVKVHKEIYDCKKKSIVHEEICENPEEIWQQPRKEEKKEEINIEALEREIEISKKRRRKIEDEIDRFIVEEIKPILSGTKRENKDEKQLSIFDNVGKTK